MKTLIVDDEQFVRWFFKRFLSKWGHSVTTAGNISEAFGILDDNTFDIVVIDLRLPDEEGMDLVDTLLENLYEPHQLIVCSAFISAHVKNFLTGKGIHILRKPFTSEELRQVLSGAAQPTQ